MNILYVLNSGNPGGMEQHVLDLISGVSNLDNSVFVLCPEGPFTSQFENKGAKVTFAKIGFDVDPIYIFNLVQLIKQQKIDLIHAHELKAVINALLAGRISNTPVISHTHTPISEWQIPLWKKKLNTFLYSFMVNALSSKEIALTESRKKVKLSEGIKEHKIAIIPNGVDLDKTVLTDSIRDQNNLEIRQRYNIPIDAHVFGCVSRISSEKGHSVLVSAYKKAKELLSAKQVEDKTFLFIGGGGPLENDLKEQIKFLGLEASSVITGRFPVEDNPKFYSCIDSFIFPSLAEGFGIVLIEAMSHALPVVCSDLEVLQEVGGASVRYFETGNSDDLSEKMVDMYLRKDQYEPLGEQGLQRVRELFSMETFVEKYLDLYKEVLET